jgi:hypothetical protein
VLLHYFAKDNRKRTDAFYTLWVLYVLSAATVALDTANFVVSEFVSDNERLLFFSWC